MCNQTELKTIGCAAEIIPKILKLKEDDLKEAEEDRKMSHLDTIVSFEADVPKGDLAKADEMGIKVLTFDELLSAGDKAIKEGFN